MDSNELQSPQYVENIEASPIPVRVKVLKHLKTNFHEGNQRKIKITAAALAVALGPFGMHRLYLGTSPLVPAVYVATVGGGVGILPFIDFVVLIFSKDITPYINNKQIFMWVNN